MVPGDAINAQSFTLWREPQRVDSRTQCGTSSVMALPGRLGTQWASNALQVLTRAPRALQILVAMDTCGQGWGGDWPHRKGGQMDPQLARCKTHKDLLCRNKKELRTKPGCHCPPSAQDSSHCVPARGARPDPKPWGWGCQCLALPPWLPFPALGEGNRDRSWSCAPGSCSHELI